MWTSQAMAGSQARWGYSPSFDESGAGARRRSQKAAGHWTIDLRWQVFGPLMGRSTHDADAMGTCGCRMACEQGDPTQVREAAWVERWKPAFPFCLVIAAWASRVLVRPEPLSPGRSVPGSLSKGGGRPLRSETEDRGRRRRPPLCRTFPVVLPIVADAHAAKAELAADTTAPQPRGLRDDRRPHRRRGSAPRQRGGRGFPRRADRPGVARPVRPTTAPVVRHHAAYDPRLSLAPHSAMAPPNLYPVPTRLISLNPAPADRRTARSRSPQAAGGRLALIVHPDGARWSEDARLVRASVNDRPEALFGFLPITARAFRSGAEEIGTRLRRLIARCHDRAPADKTDMVGSPGE